MTEQQLVETVAKKTDRSKADVEQIVGSAFDAIAETLGSNRRVDLRGFGSFLIKEKKARQGRNPRTGETLPIPARRDAAFKPGKELNERIPQPS